jgi:DNA polymerase
MSELDGLKEECLGCRKCLVGGREIDGMSAHVFSSMNAGAKVMVVGQNPGREEVADGEPFTGDSGVRFCRLVKEVVGLDREDLYLSNVVRCFMPGNRRPCQSEMDNCRSFLDREVEIVDPKVIVAIGRPTMKQLTGVSGGIIKNCGKLIFSPRYGRYVLALIHPSKTNMNNEERRELFMGGLRELKRHLEEMDGGQSDSGGGE